MLAVLAAAAIAAANPVVVVNPDWERVPSGNDLAAYYPATAEARGVEGRVRLQCQVNIRGDVGSCVVVKEAPAGVGFGAAALRLTPLFHMKPGTRDGIPQPSRVLIPVRFRLAPPGDRLSPAFKFPSLSPKAQTALGLTPLLALLFAALADGLAGARRGRAGLGAAVAHAVGLIGRMWLRAPGPLLLLVLASVAFNAGVLAPAWASPLALVTAALAIFCAALMSSAAACRVAFRRVQPEEPRFRAGPLGLGWGATEARILAAEVISGLFIVAGAASATGLLVLAAWGARAGAVRLGWSQALGSADQIVQYAGGGPVLLTCFALGAAFLIASRLFAMIPQVAFDPEIDIWAAWRDTRGSWFTAGAAQAGLWLVVAGAVFAVTAGLPVVMKYLPAALGSPSPILVRAGLYGLAIALLAPFRSGLALYIFGRARGLAV